MNGQYLENVSTDKLLGVKINHNLSWEEHIKSIERKVNSKLALLWGIKGCLPLETRKGMWVPTYFHTWITVLQYGETRIMCTVYNLDRSESPEPFWM